VLGNFGAKQHCLATDYPYLMTI